MPTSQGRPIELYYWPTPNGWKITIMLEELGAPYEVKYVNIGKGEQFTPEFLAISPNNRMPAIVDPGGPDGRPISVFESAVILMYLGRKFGRFYPSDERGRVEVEEWLAWQIANVGPVFGHHNHFRHYAPEKVPYAIRRFGDEAHPPVWRAEQAPRWPRVRRRRIFDRRHGDLRLDQELRAPRCRYRRVPAREALAGRHAGAAGGRARDRDRQRQALQSRHR